MIRLNVLMAESKHYIFSDESGWDSDNRFGSLAKISGSFEHTLELHNELKRILEYHEKDEVKFKEIKNHKNKTLACEFLHKSFEFINASKIKIHVIVWDKHDSRHSVQNRCDIENLKRMYYHNMKSLLKSWSIDTNWHFYPDEFTAIDWRKDIVHYIENTRLLDRNDIQQKLFEVFEGVTFPTVTNTKELDSKNYPIIQLADLYAGLVRTSRSESDSFNKWCYIKETTNQPSLFQDENITVEVSNSLRPKFEVMYDFRAMAKQYKLGVNFSESKYFKTFNNKKNITIWHYEPQNELDKAPTKNN